MKKIKKYFDINLASSNNQKVVDLRNKNKVQINEPVLNVGKKNKTSSAKKIKKSRGNIILVNNAETKFNPAINSNIEVNFLRVKKKKKPSRLRKKVLTKSKKNYNLISSKYTKIFYSKSLAFFLIIALFSVSTIRVLAFFQDDLLTRKDKIINGAEIAYKYMDSGQQSIFQKDYDLASYKFSVASERFDATQQELEVMGKSVIDALSLFPVGNQVASADYLLEAGSNIAVASEYIAYALMPFKQTSGILSNLEENNQSENQDVVFTDALQVTNSNLTKALDKIKLAENNLNKVNEDSLPGDVSEQVVNIKKQIPQIRYVLEKYLSFSDLILKLLGHDNVKKYLFLFQNNRELRATGGFIGTYGQFDINEGRIENIKIEGPYNVDGQLFDNIAAPEPMRLIVSRFYMRDANWFSDFPTSAKKISSLYEKSGQATTDGVVAVTSNLFNELLKVTGPIDMPEYGKTITSDNFYEETQKQVEFEYDKEENKPKKFIADMFPKIIERLSDIDKERWPDLINLMISSFERKDILLYFKDQELENVVKDFGWAGDLIETKKDYLDVVSTNIGGGKTDHVIDQDVYLNTDIKSDGSVINTLTISRKHNGNPEKLFEDVKNVAYLRFYVPLGSALIEAEGFDGWFYDVLKDPEEGYVVDNDLNENESNMEVFGDTKTRTFKESGKTVFGNWMGVEAGQEKVARIKYKLPFKINLDENNPIKNYSIVLQRQPGSENRILYGNIDIPDNWKSVWKYSSSGIKLNEFEYQSEQLKDDVLGIILANKNFSQ